MDEKGKRRRYQPPQPDENTFATQELFFESLQPCSVDLVAEHNRRCAHCWKRYGETDPGFDNAEEPVMLRCGHSFGIKCMQELFALPAIIKTDLVPLQFGPKSMGVKLARSLEKRLGTSGEAEYPQLVGQVLAGIYMSESDVDMDSGWRLIFASISPSLHILNIRLYENAIVYDIHESRKHTSFDTSLFGSDFTGTEPAATYDLVEPEFPAETEADEVTQDVPPSNTSDDRRKQGLISTLGPLIDALICAYSTYKSMQPSPLDSQVPDTSAAPATTPRNLTVPTCVTIHTDDLGSGHYQVSMPYRHSVLASPYDDIGEADTQPSSDLTNQLRPFFILCRQICTSTCCFKEDHVTTKAREKMTGTVPTSIGWTKDKSTPNTCPICSKVLYNRA